jgi:hypothetical protein
MMLLYQLVEKVRLSKADIEFLEERMSNGTVFKTWVAKDNPGQDMLARCLKYELSRPRVRSDIFRSIVERYNRQLSDYNRRKAYALLEKVA